MYAAMRSAREKLAAPPHIVGTDGRIYTRMEQAGADGAPVRRQWLQILPAANLTNIAMGPGGNPWYVDANGNIGWVLR
jgi:hypothetical protein